MKIRINDLARELEVKSKTILDVLPDLGITEKKTHSSSLEADEAEKIRKHFTAKSVPASSRERSGGGEVKPKLDLSKISKPGDVFKLLKEKGQQPQPVISKPATAVSPVSTVIPSSPQTLTRTPAPEEVPATTSGPKLTPPPAAEKRVLVTPPTTKPATPPAPPVSEKPAGPAVV